MGIFKSALKSLGIGGKEGAEELVQKKGDDAANLVIKNGADETAQAGVKVIQPEAATFSTVIGQSEVGEQATRAMDGLLPDDTTAININFGPKADVVPTPKAVEAPRPAEPTEGLKNQADAPQEPVRDTQNSGGNGGSGQEPPKKTGAGDEGEGAGKGDDGGAADKAAFDAMTPAQKANFRRTEIEIKNINDETSALAQTSEKIAKGELPDNYDVLKKQANDYFENADKLDEQIDALKKLSEDQTIPAPLREKHTEKLKALETNFAQKTETYAEVIGRQSELDAMAAKAARGGEGEGKGTGGGKAGAKDFDPKLHGREALPAHLRGVNDDEIAKAIKEAEGKFHQIGLQKNVGREQVRNKEEIEKDVLKDVSFIDRTLWHARPKKVETVYKNRYETQIREAIEEEASKFEAMQRLYRVNRADAANDIAYLVARKHNLDVLNHGKEGELIDLTKPWEVKSFIESTGLYNGKAGSASRIDPNLEYHNGSIAKSDNVFDKTLHDKIDGQDLAVTKQDSDLRKERIVRFFEEKDFVPSRLIGKTIAGNILDGSPAGGIAKTVLAIANLPLYAFISTKGVVSKLLFTGAAVVGTGYLAEEAETRDNAGNDYKGKGFDKGQMIDKGFVFAGEENKTNVLWNNSILGAGANGIRIWWNGEDTPKVKEIANPESEAVKELRAIRNGKANAYNSEHAAQEALEAIRDGDASSDGAKPTELPEQQVSPEAAAAAALEAIRNGNSR